MNKKLLFCCAIGLSCLVAQAGHVTSRDKVIDADSIHIFDDVEIVARARQMAPTLSRINVPLSKLPMTVSHLEASQLRLRGYYNPMDALRYVPAAGLRMSYGAFLQLNIRGFDYSPIIVDGVRDERSTINSFPLGDLSEVASIEVLKGPASVLQGHSAVGGVLSINRRRPTAERSLSARLEYGSWRHHRLVASLGGKLAGRWNGLMSLSYMGGDGWRNTGDKRFKVYATAGAQWERDSLIVRASYHRDFYGTEIGVPATLSEPVYNLDGTIYLPPRTLQPKIQRHTRYNNESDAMYNKSANVTLAWMHKFGDNLRLANDASYADDIIDYFSTEELSYPTSDPFDLASLPAVAPYKYYTERGGKRTYIDMEHVQLTYPLRFEHHARTFQNQLQLSGDFSTGAIKHTWAAGYALSYMRRVSYTGYKFANGGKDITGPGLFSIIDAYNPQSAGPMQTQFSAAIPTHTWSHGVYAQNVIELLPSLQTMIALRYDRYKYGRASTSTIDGKREFEDPSSDSYAWAKSQALTYRVGVVYSPLDDVNIYTSLASFYLPYQTTYNDKTIYVNSSGDVFSPEANQEIFKPRTGGQIELGVRAAVSKWFSLSASGFCIKQNNIVKTLGTHEEVVNGATVKKTIQGQVGTIVSKGFEIEARLSPLEGLSLTLGYSLTDARHSKLVQNKYLEYDVQEGNPLNYIPKHQLMSYGNYTVQRGLLRGLDLHYALSYRSRRYINYGRGQFFESDAICDLGVAYQTQSRLTIGLDVYNVFNRESFQQSLGNQWVFNAPTNFKVSLSYRL